MGTLGGNLCLDTRCTYYNQSYEWRKAIDFCMKKDGAICWVAPASPRCWAVQSSDLAPVMVALGAEFLLVGPDGERVVPAGAFYANDGMAYLTKQPDEVLAEVWLPATNGWDATYHKLRRRGSFDFPVLGVAAWVRWDGDAVADARIILGGVASWPQTVAEAADAVRGSRLEPDAVEAAAGAAFRPSKPMDNTDFGLAWRKEMTRGVRRALRSCARRWGRRHDDRPISASHRRHRPYGSPAGRHHRAVPQSRQRREHAGPAGRARRHRAVSALLLERAPRHRVQVPALDRRTTMRTASWRRSWARIPRPTRSYSARTPRRP
jgi:CO/xanthine dehydrogenase FAD-binding subunit